jgi:hypothetical protein
MSVWNPAGNTNISKGERVLRTVIAVVLVIGTLCGLAMFVSWAKDRDIKELQKNTSVVVIDGCEYLRFPLYYHDGLTHKGNCKNPIHLYRDR